MMPFQMPLSQKRKFAKFFCNGFRGILIVMNIANNPTNLFIVHCYLWTGFVSVLEVHPIVEVSSSNAVVSLLVQLF
mgnify:CR=1 FL=1